MVATEEIERWEGLCYSIAADYHAPGMEREDLMQEARIGVTKALRDYRPDRGAFAAFVALCVRRQVITAVKAATRAKHEPLNRSVRVMVDSDDGEPEEAVAFLKTGHPGPDAILERREEHERLVAAVRSTRLSRVEYGCITGLLRGDSYEAIAAREGVTTKTVDNAIQRARLKLSRSLKNDRPGCETPRRGRRPGRTHMTRTTDEILRDARSELVEREQRLAEIQNRTKTELEDVRKAIRKLGGSQAKRTVRGGASKNGHSANGGGPDAEERRQKVIDVLEQSIEPLSPSDIADRAGIDGRGMPAVLRHMKDAGLVVKVEDGWGLPSKVDTETSSGALADRPG